MSHSDIHVEKYDNMNTAYSCGDANSKKKQLYQEENNNEVDELSKELSEMGCIVDAVKRPSNICVETCVYESDSENEESQAHINDNDEVHYSDEFEEDNSDVEEIQDQNKSTNSEAKINSNIEMQPTKSSVKLVKSQASVTSTKPPSLSGRSSGFGSISVPATRRTNMSFTNERLREIERHNHILLNKILCARNSKKSSIPAREPPAPKRPVPPAAVHRKLQQKKIDHDNMILLKKIQRAKSSACSVRR